MVSVDTVPLDSVDVNSSLQPLPAGIFLRADRYEMGALLGRGGFSLTYRAWDHTLQTHVAIKELFPTDASRMAGHADVIWHVDSQISRKFKDHAWNEARVLCTLRDAAIVRGLDVWEEHGTVYFAMEYLEGLTLEDRIKQSLLDEPEAVDFLKNLLRALEKIHAAQLLHRDIKPSNIILTPQHGPVLIDFGTAFYMDGQPLTSRLLTPHYAPLEQYGRSIPLHPATDLYALSATFCHALTGSLVPTAIDRIHGDVSVDWSARVHLGLSALSPHLTQLLEQGLSMRLDLRPQSARAMLDQLQVPPSTPEPVSERPLPKRHPWKIGVVFALLALAVIAGFGWKRFMRAAPVQPVVSVVPVRPKPAVVVPSAPTVPAPPTPVSPEPPVQPVDGVQKVILGVGYFELRSQPDSDSPIETVSGAPIALRRGETGEVLREESDFVYVQTQGGRGWLPKALVVPSGPLLDLHWDGSQEMALKPGVYVLGQPIPEGMTLTVSGSGVDQTFLIYKNGARLTAAENVANLQFRDLTLVREAADQPIAEFKSGSALFERVRFLGGSGLKLEGTANVTLKDSEVLGSFGYGIDARGNSVLKVQNGRLEWNAEGGIALREQSQSELTDSHFDHGKYGLSVSGQAVVNLQNSEFRNQETALVLSGEAQVQLEGNRCDLNGNNADVAPTVRTGVREDSCGVQSSGIVSTPSLPVPSDWVSEEQSNGLGWYDPSEPGARIVLQNMDAQVLDLETYLQEAETAAQNAHSYTRLRLEALSSEPIQWIWEYIQDGQHKRAIYSGHEGLIRILSMEAPDAKWGTYEPLFSQMPVSDTEVPIP